MTLHPDPERLVLLALDERTESWTEDITHLATCSRCRAETDSLRAVAGLAIDAEPEQRLPPASEAVWERIAAATVAPTLQPAGRSADKPASRRARARWWRYAATAVAAAAAGAAAAVGVTAIDGTDGRVIARVTLAAQAAGPPTATGTVAFVDSGGGHLVAHLSMKDVPAPDGLYQVWLYNGNTTMIPLGVTTGSTVDLPVPSTVSLSAFPIVDVSVQRIGQQEHGVSILRGTII